jgi:hypothetical protein
MRKIMRDRDIIALIFFSFVVAMAFAAPAQWLAVVVAMFGGAGVMAAIVNLAAGLIGLTVPMGAKVQRNGGR